ncbi:MAG TPA: serine/threonine-protein kinase [Gemmatimonadaceae bacterium]|nr:serine/threonine-protein kinase [Gemmatimonadaceae bacterium]
MSALKICPQCGTEYELDQRFCPKDGSTLRMQAATGDLLGSIIADRYHVLKKLGEGGMGTVYLAEHVKMGRKSAVKVMNPGTGDDPDAISRFNREASNASKINHPNVAAIYDFGETSDGMIYLAMEFIEGPSLTSIIKEAGALPPTRAADIARQAAEALAVAHDMGIVHRDLKPDNIMIAKNRDGSDCAKVVDFGIAKAANNEAQKVTKTGLVVGTPEYMSPEQLAGDKLDGRSDIYSLALVAFNMMTGKLPFPGETVQESMIMRLTDRPRPLAQMKPDVSWPEALQAVLDKALERDANDRYQTASEFGRELWKSVQGMRASSATAILSPTHAETARSKKDAPPLSDKTAPIPHTRVSKATPPSLLATKKEKPKSRTPLLAAIAAAVVLLAGGGTYMALGARSDKSPPATQQGDSVQRLSQQVASTPAPIDLAASFEQIENWTDLNAGATAATARQALAKLDSIAPAARADSDKVHVELLRAESHFVLSEAAAAEADKSSEKTAGCTILKEHEGRASKTRFVKRFNFFLRGDPAKGLPKTC